MRKLLAYSLLLLLAGCGGEGGSSASAPAAEALAPTVYKAQSPGFKTDLAQSFAIKNQWPGGYQGEWTLTYQGTDPLINWTLQFDLDAKVQTLWGATFLGQTQGGSSPTRVSLTGNGTLKPGDRLVVGFVALAASPAAPRNAVLSAPSAGTAQTGVTATFTKGNDWGAGFVGEVRVTNSGSTAVSGWQVQLRSVAALSGVWNADLLSHEGDLYRFGSKDYNGALAPGQSVTFGFQGAPSAAVTVVTPAGSSPSPSPSPTATPTTVPVTPGYFHTQGSRILDSNNQPVVMHGLNWFGMETTNLAPHGLWTRSLGAMLDQMRALGYDTLRLPFSNDVVRNTGQPNGIDFSQNPALANLKPLQVMDQVIAEAGKRNMRVILDRHRPDSNAQSELWYSPSCSEQQWLADWETLAARYRNNPTVIGCDLHNEPHGAATWGDGNSATDWRLAAQKAGNRILAVNPNLLIVVEGVERVGGDSYWWGGNLAGARSAPVQLSVPGRLVYSAHDYATSVYRQSWFDAPNFPANLPGIWDAHWGYLVKEQRAPVLVGEFGSTLQASVDVTWMNALVDYLKGNAISSTYWCWNPNSGDTGGILQTDWRTVDTRKQTILNRLLP